MTQAQLITLLKSLQLEAKQKYKASIKGVFGSYARNTASADSDLDLLVEFDEDADLFDFTGLGDFLETNIRCKVDLVTPNALRQEIRDKVLSDLIPL